MELFHWCLDRLPARCGKWGGFVGSDDHKVYALDAKTGTELWSYTTDGEIFISAPAVRNGIAYVGSCGIGTGHTVYPLNASTGTLLWSYATGAGIQASFAIEGGLIYVASADTYLYALDATTGVKRWDYLSGGFYTSSPTAANGVIYIGSGAYGLATSHGERAGWRTLYRAPGGGRKLFLTSPCIDQALTRF